MSETEFVFVDNPATGRYSALFAACGYEARSSYIARSMSRRFERTYAYAYAGPEHFGYSDNVSYFAQHATLRHPSSAEMFSESLETDIREVLGGTAGRSIAIDVSSFDRDRLSRIVRVVDRIGREMEVRVDFLYSAASFDSHTTEPDETVMVNGPLPSFEGWASDPSAPVACVIGLGFEDVLALAALETLEPSKTVAFVARSDDERFENRVVAVNDHLMRAGELALVDYVLTRPFDLVHKVESVVHSLLPSYRVALVPLGPKLFALACLLTAQSYGDQVTIWRVSADESRHPVDREPTGRVAVLSVIARSSSSSAGHR